VRTYTEQLTCSSQLLCPIYSASTLSYCLTSSAAVVVCVRDDDPVHHVEDEDVQPIHSDVACGYQRCKHRRFTPRAPAPDSCSAVADRSIERVLPKRNCDRSITPPAKSPTIPIPTIKLIIRAVYMYMYVRERILREPASGRRELEPATATAVD